MEQVYVLYTVDYWHSYDSREITAICGDMQTINEMIVKHAEQKGSEVTEKCLIQIQSINQTQTAGDVDRGFEYLVELVKIDELL
jgi:hypothetical protein